MRRWLGIVLRLSRYLIIAVLGFVVGVLAIYVSLMRSGPPLERWHTVQLTDDFRAGDTGEVSTFDDYLRLEERLFSRLDEVIYDQTETGKAFALARYSAGSLADPRRWERNWNRSFELPSSPPACGVLLLHGMTDSPYSLRALGESVNRRGCWVVGLRMPGHGTIPSGLLGVEWEDMAAAVRLAMEHLYAKVSSKPVHIIAYSTGATLALRHVLDTRKETNARSPDSLVLISPAIGITPAAALAVWIDRLASLPGLEKLAWSGILPEFDPFKYNSFANNAGRQVHRLTRSVADDIEATGESGPIPDFPPTLVFLSAVDATVSVNAVIDNLLEHLAADRHELVLFDINRNSLSTTVLVSDPGPLTKRLMTDDRLAFRVSLITNEHTESTSVVSRWKVPLSAEISVEPLQMAWPLGVISLSHIALPFSPDDPLYGKRQSKRGDVIHLGEVSLQGERGLLKFPSDWLIRLRHNPFYGYLEERVLTWVGLEESKASSDG